MKSFDQDEDRRITIVPKNDRYGAFGSALLLLPKGTLLCSYGRIDFERGVNQKIIIDSKDRGRTWSEPRIVDEKDGIAKTLRGDSLSRLSDRRIAMIGNTVGKDGRASGFEIRWSHDYGRTWGEPVIVEGKGTIPWCNRIIETTEGDLLITTRAPSNIRLVKKVVMQIISRDGGRTWEGPEIIAEDPVLKLTEPSTIRLIDGRLMTVIRETSYNHFPSYRIFSVDDGRTWSGIEELPIHGHELCLGQLQSGRAMVAYRHVGGYAATFAWVGDPDDTAGFQVPATIHAHMMPDFVDNALRIRTVGKGETVLYHLHPPESQYSTIRIEAELRCIANEENACGIHVAQAGWVGFYTGHIELPDCGGISTDIDTKVFQRYVIIRDQNKMTLFVEGKELLRTEDLDRGKGVKVDYGTIYPNNVNAFGTQSPLMGDLKAMAKGEAHWRSFSLNITNQHLQDHEYEWNASSGRLPNQYEEDHMIEIENNYGGSIYFVGQVSWVQFPDGEIFVVTGRQFIREDGRRSSWLRGCYLREEDFSPKSV